MQKRPTFTTTKKGLQTRQKSLIWWTCRRLAKLEKSSRCTLSLTEETSSVDELFTSRRITSKPLYFIDRRSSFFGDMYTWNFSLIAPDGNMSTTTSDSLHATWPFLVVVKVGRFRTASAFCPGGGLKFVLVAVLWYVFSKSLTCLKPVSDSGIISSTSREVFVDLLV